MKLTASTTKTLKNGVKIPILGLGVYKAPKEETEHIVYTALKQGYRHVDTAQFYGNEREVGLAIARFLKDTPEFTRSDVFYTTKVSPTNHGYEQAKKSILESLEKVKEIGYVDLFLIHNPMAEPEQRLGTWRALQEFYEEGKIKAIGVSNYSIKHLEELLNWKELKVEPMVNQYELNPWLLREDLCAFCESKGIIIEAFSPLTRGFRMKDPLLQKVIEKSYPGKSPAQILIRWSLQKGFIPLPKSSNEQRLRANLESLDFEISDEDMKTLTHENDYFVSNPNFDPIKNCP
ncbi:LANO_0D02366g1_1 [Lachancea nothofagi CBS 11611]|uniref:LANO_0D02366g1_1 n=1 Tax=Lachancea nothofagi CBS 11611 TaxID=1266666 RepID=A0A1G4JE47_9SACH|nr:LANO_0D02366g1_1 [Lachancea nothofagi CBS 11611]